MGMHATTTRRRYGVLAAHGLLDAIAEAST
jgi:hypothetical protein